MSKEIANENDFDAQLKKLGELYEAGKDCIAKFYPSNPMAIKNQLKMYKILKEMRDMCAVQLQQKHWIDPN